MLARRGALSSGPHWFRPALLATVCVGVVARIVFVTTTTFPKIVDNDAAFFRGSALNLADGRGYVAASLTDSHKLVATAAHPPLFSCVLAVFDLLGLQSVDEQRIALALVASAAVFIMGLLGREVAGPAVGIGAALIAALDPLWLQPIGALMSESVYLVVVPLVVLLAVRCLDEPTVWRFGALGLVMAVAALTRSEALDFIVLLGVPLLLMARLPWKSRCLLGAALVVGASLLLVPWLVRNQVQIGGAVLFDQEGGTLAGSYCSATFDPADPAYGSFDGGCAVGLAAVIVARGRPPNGSSGWTELSLDRALTEAAKHFALSHLGDLPAVVLAREGSAWGLGNQNFQLQLSGVEGRNRTYEVIGRTLYWVFVPFIVIGSGVLARRSPRRFVIIIVPVVVVVLTVALTYGSTRLRVAAEPSLAVLAAIGAVTVGRWLRARPEQAPSPVAAPSSDRRDGAPSCGASVRDEHQGDVTSHPSSCR